MPRTPTWTQNTDTELLGLYVKGRSLCELADDLGYSEAKVRVEMLRLGLERLPQGRPVGRRDTLPRPPRSARSVG